MTREEFLDRLPELVESYRASPEVVQKIGNLILLMLVGPSGAGKTTLINRLGYHYVASDNSRPPRPEEREGIDYFFRIDYEQIIAELKAGQFVQVVIDSGGDLKASRADAYPDSGVAVLAVVADVVPEMREYGFAKTLSVFIAPPSQEEWLRRMGSHNLQGEQLKFALEDDQVHLILNDSVVEALAQIINLVEKGEVDQEREAQARQAVETIYEQLLHV